MRLSYRAAALLLGGSWACAATPAPTTPATRTVASVPMETEVSRSQSFSDLSYAHPGGDVLVERSLRLPALAEVTGVEGGPRVSYVEEGRRDAPPVILLHGLGSNLGFWRTQLRPLASAGMRVIALDMLGFGKSDKPEGFRYDTLSMVAVLTAIMDALELKQAAIVGHSLGGQVALRMAMEAPDRVRRLALLSPAGLEPFTPAEQEALRPLVTAEGIMALGPELIRKQLGLNFARWRAELEWLVSERVAMRDYVDFEAYAKAQVASFRGLLDTEPTRTGASEVSQPTLVIYGSADVLIPNRALHPTLDFEKLLGPLRRAGAAIERLESCGHLIQLDCPEEVNERLVAFLTSKDPS